MPRGQQPQQQSAIQKWTLVRPDTLRDLLSARQKGPCHRHHQPAVLNKKKKAQPLSPLPGLVDDDVPLPDGDGATQWSAWDVGCASLKPRPEAWEGPPTGRRRLLQDLRRDLDTILYLSGRRRCRARAPRHRRRTARRRHSKGPPRVGTVPGPLPTASSAGLGPDQGGVRHTRPHSPSWRAISIPCCATAIARRRQPLLRLKAPQKHHHLLLARARLHQESPDP